MKPWRDLVESGAVDLMDPVERLQLADILEEQGEPDTQYATLREDAVLYFDGKFYPRWLDTAKAWDFGNYADVVTYCNQREVYGDSLEGNWFYADDVNCVVHWGTFGNDHSPGTSGNTFVTVFDTRPQYESQKRGWEKEPEFEPDDPDWEDDFDAEEDANDEWVE